MLGAPSASVTVAVTPGASEPRLQIDSRRVVFGRIAKVSVGVTAPIRAGWPLWFRSARSNRSAAGVLGGGKTVPGTALPCRLERSRYGGGRIRVSLTDF